MLFANVNKNERMIHCVTVLLCYVSWKTSWVTFS